MNKIKFSIAIPAFKGKFLKETIESCLSQTYKLFEIIIIDDCSPEDLGSIVCGYKDDRITYVRNTNNYGPINVVDNWNKCLSLCSGQYVICMGDDDRLLPNCLEEYYKLIGDYPDIGVLHGWTEIINEQSEVVKPTSRRCLHESVYSLIWHRWNCYRLQFIGDFCYNVEWLKSQGGFYKLPLAWASDDITAIIGATKNGIANTQIPVFQYRVNSATITNTSSAVVKMDAIMLEAEWYTIFLEKKPNNIIDILYWKEIIKQLNNRIDQKKRINIANDLKSKGWFRLIWWIGNRRRYNLTIKNILKAVVLRKIVK